MTEGEKNLLLKKLETSEKFIDEFFIFHQNTRVQLMSNQLQYFQSIGGIALATLTILLGTDTVNISIWWFFTWVTALVLVIYVSTYVRELNDSHDNGLVEEEKNLKSIQQGLMGVISDAVKKNDFSVYQSYVIDKEIKLKKSDTKPEMSYAGEIAIFLFFLTIFFGIEGIFYSKVCISSYLCIFIVTISGILVCFIGAMEDWNLKITSILSTKLYYLFKKIEK